MYSLCADFADVIVMQLGLRTLAAWLSSNGAAHINEVSLRRARLVLGWVTVSRFNSWCDTVERRWDL